MNVFATALDCIYANPSMAVAALWISATTSEETPIRVLRRAPDRTSEFGSERFVSDTIMVDVLVADLPDPHPGDLIVVGADSFTVQGESVRDRERLIWTLDLRPRIIAHLRCHLRIGLGKSLKILASDLFIALLPPILWATGYSVGKGTLLHFQPFSPPR